MKLLYKVLSVMLVLLVLAMTVVMFLQITMRTVGLQSFKWSEEVLRYLYIWVVFLGVPTAVYTNDLTRFDLLQTKLNPQLGRVLETIIIVFMLIILYFMGQGSLTLIRVQMRQPRVQYFLSPQFIQAKKRMIRSQFQKILQQ